MLRALCRTHVRLTVCLASASPWDGGGGAQRLGVVVSGQFPLLARETSSSCACGFYPKGAPLLGAGAGGGAPGWTEPQCGGRCCWPGRPGHPREGQLPSLPSSLAFPRCTGFRRARDRGSQALRSAVQPLPGRPPSSAPADAAADCALPPLRLLPP